jgi:hypothetical protein
MYVLVGEFFLLFGRTMRTNFRREYPVDVLQAMREALPSARRWLTSANAVARWGGGGAAAGRGV